MTTLLLLGCGLLALYLLAALVRGARNRAGRDQSSEFARALAALAPAAEPTGPPSSRHQTR